MGKTEREQIIKDLERMKQDSQKRLSEILSELRKGKISEIPYWDNLLRKTQERIDGINEAIAIHEEYARLDERYNNLLIKFSRDIVGGKKWLG